jgi:hypothetical protein
VVEFLRRCDDFRVDPCREKHLLSFNPGGFLRRVRKTDQVRSSSMAATSWPSMPAVKHESAIL